MSVPKSERGESEVEFVRTMRELQIHTIRKCKGFPKSYTFYLGVPMAQLAGQAYMHVVEANSIYPARRSDYLMRRGLLIQAHSEVRALVAQLEVTAEVFGVRMDGVRTAEMGESEGRKMDYWMDIAHRETALLKGVIKRDDKRYGNLPD